MSDTTADQKHEWAAAVRWPVRDHILVEEGEGRRLVEVDNALESRLCPHALRVIVAASDDNATMSIADILELERQHFAGTQPAIQHQSHQSKVTRRTQRRQQQLHLLRRQRPRHTNYRPHRKAATHRPLPACSAHSWPMSV